MSRFLEAVAAGVLAAALAGGAYAQSTTSAPAGGGSTTTPAGAAPARSGIVPQDDLPPGAAPGGIQGQNIFDVKPEVKRDASNDPGYMEQNNGQRNRVQPGNNAPMWRGVQAGREGYSSLPKSEWPEAGVLIQPQVQYPGNARMTTAGQAWREVRNNWIIPYGGALLIIVALALGIFYFAKGPLGHAMPDSGRPRIERFTPFERAAHWSNAIAFVVLGISGIVMASGKFFLLPVIGLTLFGYLTYILKNLHSFFGPLFAVSLLVVIVTFIRDNFPQKGDLRWLLRMGNIFKGPELPSHRFNAMEKVVFWTGTLVLGIVVIGSGLVMDKLIPGISYDRQTMQVTHMVHATAAALMLAILFVHIYVGTVGIRGSYTAMRTGYVNDAWAEEHHAYWYEDVKAGRIPVQRSQPLVIVDDSADKVRPA